MTKNQEKGVNLDRSLVGLHFAELIELLHVRPGLNKPLNDLTFSNT